MCVRLKPLKSNYSAKSFLPSFFHIFFHIFRTKYKKNKIKMFPNNEIEHVDKCLQRYLHGQSGQTAGLQRYLRGQFDKTAGRNGEENRETVQQPHQTATNKWSKGWSQRDLATDLGTAAGQPESSALTSNTQVAEITEGNAVVEQVLTEKSGKAAGIVQQQEESEQQQHQEPTSSSKTPIGVQQQEFIEGNSAGNVPTGNITIKEEILEPAVRQVGPGAVPWPPENSNALDELADEELADDRSEFDDQLALAPPQPQPSTSSKSKKKPQPMKQNAPPERASERIAAQQKRQSSTINNPDTLPVPSYSSGADIPVPAHQKPSGSKRIIKRKKK